MKYSIEELNPANPVLIVNKKEIELSLITLELEVKLKEKFGSLDNLLDSLDKNIFNITWMLVIDKSCFGLSQDNFKNEIIKCAEGHINTIKNMTSFLYEIIDKSRPLIKNKKRMEDIQKIRNAGKDEVSITPCYASYFDTVASRYSFTLETFYKLTLRQLHGLLKACGDGKYEDLEMQAALAGRKLQPKMEMNDNVTPEDEERQEQDAMEAVKKLQEEYERNKDK